MARTYRRRRLLYEYYWVLLEDWKTGKVLNRRSKSGRKELARFHSEMAYKHHTPPRSYCKAFDNPIRTLNDRMLRRCLIDPDFEPLFQARHHHNATWFWR